MSLITGIKVGKTDIISTYSDGLSKNDSVEFTVNTVSLGTISSIEDAIYCGTELRPLPIITAVVGGETVELQNGIDYELTYSNNRNAGQATVTATGIGNFNGTLSTSWTIQQKEAVLTWGDLNWVYDGNQHQTTCVVSNLEPGDICTVTLTGNSITNIGSTTVTATALSNSNYKLPSNVSNTLIVSPGLFVKLSGVWTPVKKVYKRVSGFWVEQEMQNAFSTSERYVRMN